jgi:hypothetical protein
MLIIHYFNNFVKRFTIISINILAKLQIKKSKPVKTLTYLYYLISDEIEPWTPPHPGYDQP